MVTEMAMRTGNAQRAAEAGEGIAQTTSWRNILVRFIDIAGVGLSMPGYGPSYSGLGN